MYICLILGPVFLCLSSLVGSVVTVRRSLIKKAQIFTRDLSAEEGRDYFTADNDLGLLRFGPAEVYKEIKIAHQRTISRLNLEITKKQVKPRGFYDDDIIFKCW